MSDPNPRDLRHKRRPAGVADGEVGRLRLAGAKGSHHALDRAQPGGAGPVPGQLWPRLHEDQTEVTLRGEDITERTTLVELNYCNPPLMENYEGSDFPVNAYAKVSFEKVQGLMEKNYTFRCTYL